MEYLYDIELSLKAKGLLSYLLELNDSTITAKKLSLQLKESDKTISTILKELVDKGYVTREQIRQNNGTWGNYKYNFYSEPQGKNFTIPKSKKIDLDKEYNIDKEPNEENITFLNSIKKNELDNVSTRVYQLKITLQGVSPLIWRRIVVKSDITFNRLHNIIQEAFGWENFHLFEFELEYGGGIDGYVKISEFFENISTFIYTYDMGDCWTHYIEVEKVFKPKSNSQYPRCTAGKRCCPPEDIGGSYGYMEALKIIKNRKYAEYRQVREHIGKGFKPEYFSKQEVNERLKEFV